MLYLSAGEGSFLNRAGSQPSPSEAACMRRALIGLVPLTLVAAIQPAAAQCTTVGAPGAPVGVTACSDGSYAGKAGAYGVRGKVAAGSNGITVTQTAVVSTTNDVMAIRYAVHGARDPKLVFFENLNPADHKLPFLPGTDQYGLLANDMAAMWQDGMLVHFREDIDPTKLLN